jgi:AP-5 complex subunit zeta-1
MSELPCPKLLRTLSFSMVQMLLALMDEAYTGSAIEEPSGNSGSDDSGPLDLADPMFLDLLKDENDGIAVSSFSYTMVYIPSELLVLVISSSVSPFRQNIGYPLRYLQRYKQHLTAHSRTD